MKRKSGASLTAPSVKKKKQKGKSVDATDSVVSKKKLKVTEVGKTSTVSKTKMKIKFHKPPAVVVQKMKIKDVVPVPHKLTSEERAAREKSLYRPPTSEELQELKENENLYKNNIFRMQMTCLLDEVRATKKTKKIDAALHELHAFLKDLPAPEGQGTFELRDSACRPEGVQFPIDSELLPNNKMKGKFEWHPPTNIKVVGSFLLKTMTKPNQCVDLLVEMPKACLQDKDYQNFRYHYKRALYLSYLAKFMGSWSHTASLHFSLAPSGNPFMPSLVVSLTGKLGRRFSIRIFIGIPASAFKMERFAVEKCNVRPEWFDGTHSTSDVASEASATPYYNSAVLSNMLYESHLRTLFAAVSECPELRDAICLTKVWLAQRSFQAALQLNGFIVSFIFVYLLQEKRISAQTSSYQMFRMLLNTLATSDWSVAGASLCNSTDVRLFHDHFHVVLVDPSGYLNLMAGVDRATYRWIRREAESSLQCLDDGRCDSFSVLFMTRLEFSTSVDHIVCIRSLDEAQTGEHSVFDRGGFSLPAVTDRVVETLERGLSERVERLVVMPTPHIQWLVDAPPTSLSGSSLSIGLCLQDGYADKMMELGPSAEETVAAAEFRSFWGARSELRRFQDGSIKEAVVWKCDNREQRAQICQRIVLHLLQLHLRISPTNVSYQADQFNSLLKYRHTADKDKSAAGTGEETARHFVTVFQNLQKQIRAISDLPLATRNIDGVDDAFTCTGVLPPRQHIATNRNEALNDGHCVPSSEDRIPTWCPVHEVTVQLEASSKWPASDLLAIRMIKSAFHIRLAHSLKKQFSLPSRPSHSHVDVFKDGYVFRLHIVYAREVQLYRELSSTATNSHLASQHEDIANELDTLTNRRPTHYTFISSLSGTHHAYAETTRLAKRWVTSQMLSGYLGNEAVELIVASLFLTPSPTRYPRSHMCGFLRFLSLLSTFDWSVKPLIVNFNQEINEPDLAELEEKFTSKREQFACMHIITPYDRDASMWTKTQLPQQVLHRLATLASEALKLLNCGSEISCELAEQLFRPSTRDYHAVIQLDETVVARAFERVDAVRCVRPQSIRERISRRSLPVVDFDPVARYLEDVSATFSDIALFFYDPHGGLNIGVVWKQHRLVAQPFKILNAAYRMVPSDSRNEDASSSTVPNIPAIISDLRTMGRGLVIDVVVNT